MFLEDFIVEAIQNGICLMNKMLDVELSCVICDPPAKALVKKSRAIQVYMGLIGAHKFVKGQTTFPESCADLRTD